MFTLNTGSNSDNTVLTYDGVSLACTSHRPEDAECNNLPIGTPVPAKINEINFNPRNGTARKNQWYRNQYTISANNYVDVMEPKGIYQKFKSFRE